MSSEFDADTLGDTDAATVGTGRVQSAASNTTPTPTPRNQSAGQVATTVHEVLSTASDGARGQPADRYAQARELGRGGMGRVVEARDRWLGRRVAMKLLSVPKDPALRRRFDVEALVTAQLDHPGIPTVYERDVDADGQAYYTMRLIEGRTLSALLREAKSFEARMGLLPVVVRVAQTLAFAHERGVIHRDVKPDNVVVGPHGDAVLLDWGIAKVRGLAEARLENDPELAAHAGDQMTAHGSVLGTPAYMAPEQARGEVGQIDERTDVFALGAMLYHILAGHPPYQGASLTDVLHNARERVLAPLAKVAAQAPAALLEVANRALDADPAQRHASAGEFAQALESFMAAAVARKPSRGIERFIAATSWFGLVICLLLAAAAWFATPTFHEMGVAAWGTLVFFIVGMAVGAVEWATLGRHRLAMQGLGLVAITAISSLAGAVVGLLNVYKYLLRPEVLADAVKYREILAMGHREALGNVPFGLTLALLQAIVLTFAWRRASLAHDRGQG